MLSDPESKPEMIAEEETDLDQFASAVSDPDIATPPWAIDFQGENAPKRFSVYRNNVAYSLREALKSTYPGVLNLVGEDNFNILAGIYFNEHPPSSPMMQYYGVHFPAFLKAFEPLSHSPFLVDLAEAEKQWIVAYHSIDNSVLDPGRLGQLGEDELMKVRFVPHSAATIVQSDFRLSEMFSARKSEDIRDVDVEPLEQPEGLLITRPVLEVLHHRLDAAETCFFSEILNGNNLGSAIEKAFEIDEEFDATAAITKLLSTGVVSDLIN